MPRGRSKSKVEAEPERCEFVEDALLDYESPVILTALERFKESKEGKLLLEAASDSSSTAMMPADACTCLSTWLLSAIQVKYINALAQGFTGRTACKELGIARSEPLYWEQVSDKDKLFPLCLKVVKELRTADLEEDVWDQAINNPKASILKMFALKAAKPEYRDNPPVDRSAETVINVNLISPDGKIVPYDTSINFMSRDITPEDSEQ